jgi:DNA-binding PadR family transcriptional regulator
LIYIGHGYILHPSRIECGGAVKNGTDAPLTPAVLHILLALSAEDRHGYGIMKQVERESRGKVKMGPGTLYGSIGRMISAGLIRESDERVDPAMDDARRIYYRLTGAGRKALEAELDRYRDVVAVAAEKHVTPMAIAHGA